MALVTVVTPVAPYHLPLVDRVKALVTAQTVECEHVIVCDDQRRGAGWARNRGVDQAQSPFVAFCDADDLIQPDWIERMLAAWEPGYYVYSDWLMNDEVQRMTDYGGLWNGLHHLINCLIHVGDFRQLGGFNETIEAEDTEFWLRAHSRGLWGKRTPHVLVEYTGDGQRSQRAQQNPQFWNNLARYYKELKPMAKDGCLSCMSSPTPQQPVGERQPNDILVKTLWGGNQTQTGRVTQRSYKRNGNGNLAWIDPADAAAAPDLYEIVTPVASSELSQEEAAAVQTVLEKATKRRR